MNAMLGDKLANFERALARLKAGLKESGYELSLDGTLQRFEFTFETVWKAVRKFLLVEGYDCASPRDCMKKAFQSGYLEDEQVWLDMLKDRNLSSHVYDEKDAERIYRRVGSEYVAALERLEIFLKDKLKSL